MRAASVVYIAAAFAASIDRGCGPFPLHRLQTLCETDLLICRNKDANLTSLRVAQFQDAIGCNREGILRNSANNSLTTPLFDEPRANFAVKSPHQ
jgi:hypothetical protein